MQVYAGFSARFCRFCGDAVCCYGMRTKLKLTAASMQLASFCQRPDANHLEWLLKHTARGMSCSTVTIIMPEQAGIYLLQVRVCSCHIQHKACVMLCSQVRGPGLSTSTVETLRA